MNLRYNLSSCSTETIIFGQKAHTGHRHKTTWRFCLVPFLHFQPALPQTAQHGGVIFFQYLRVEMSLLDWPGLKPSTHILQWRESKKGKMKKKAQNPKGLKTNNVLVIRHVSYRLTTAAAKWYPVFKTDLCRLWLLWWVWFFCLRNILAETVAVSFSHLLNQKSSATYKNKNGKILPQKTFRREILLSKYLSKFQLFGSRTIILGWRFKLFCIFLEFRNFKALL